MIINTKRRKRPAVLVRFYPDDLGRLSKVCADACTPRENFIRRLVLAQVAQIIDAQKRQSPPKEKPTRLARPKGVARRSGRPKRPGRKKAPRRIRPHK